MQAANLPSRPVDFVSYELDWNESLKNYNPNLLTQAEKIKKVAIEILTLPLSFLRVPVNMAITDFHRQEHELACFKCGYEKVWFDENIKPQTFSMRNMWQRQFPSTSAIKSLRKTFKPVDFSVKTPDNVTLRGTIFHKSSKPNAKTLLICSGRSQVYQQGGFAWLLKLIRDKHLDVNVVMYNPRGYGFSEGEPSKDGFLFDAETMYQYIHQKLGVKEDNLYIYGFSLGGITATRLKALHPDTKGKIIHERSFIDTNKQIYYSVAKHVGDNVFAALISTIINWIFHLFGWEGNKLLEEWKSISSDKLVIAHKEDPFIPFKASLYQAIKENDLEDETTKTVLLETKEDRNHIIDHHFEGLSHYSDATTEEEALSIVANFLKSKSIVSI